MFRKTAQFLWMALVLSTVLVLPGCPGAKPAPISGYTPLGSVSVMVIVPQSTTIGTGTTQQFTATVNNTAVGSVQWEVNGIPGGVLNGVMGNAGTIDSSGNYTAPVFVPPNPKVTITAVADADNTQSGSATVTITGAQRPPTVAISPTLASLPIGQSLTLTATVTGPTNTSVSWLVNGIDNGNSTVGTIQPGDNDSAVYTAPAQVPNPATVTVTALSNSDHTTSASAQVTITPGTISISPTAISLQTGENFTFSATVTGFADKSVTWQVNGIDNGNATVGTIQPGDDDSAVYTAPAKVPSPATVTITAVSDADSTKLASARVTISAGVTRSPGSVSISPTTASVQTGLTLNFSASVQGSPGVSVNWQVNGVDNGNSTVGTIQPGANNTAVYTAPEKVPTPATVTITAVSDADSTQSASALVTITMPTQIANVSITPTLATVPVGKKFTFTASVTGISDASVFWEVNNETGGSSTFGTVLGSGTNDDTGTYTAPSAVPSTGSTVTVTAVSSAEPSRSASATVTITPGSINSVTISISPPSATVETGAEQDFKAQVSNATNTSVTWQVNGVTGGNSTYGTIVPNAQNSDDAVYLAPTTLPTNPNVVVSVIPNADTSISATASVTLFQPTVSVTLSPSSALVKIGQMQNFTATIKNTDNQGATWYVNNILGGNSTLGTITNNGSNQATYTAPASVPSPAAVTITAVSSADSTASGAATVTVVSNTVVQISPTTATIQVNDGICNSPCSADFTATVTGLQNTTLDWYANGELDGDPTINGTISPVQGTTVDYVAPTTQPNSPVIITAVAADGTVSNQAMVTITPPVLPPPTISISPLNPPVPPGGTQQFTAALTNNGTDDIVNWALSVPGGCTPAVCGTLNNSSSITAQTNGSPVTYFAPTNIPTPPTVTITATADVSPNPQASTTITVAFATATISISPGTLTVAAGSTSPTPFTATLQNVDPATTEVTWSLGCDSQAPPGDNCGFVFPLGSYGPGCITDGTQKTCTSSGSVQDLEAVSILYTPPGNLGSNFQENSCTQTAGTDGMVPLTASIAGTVSNCSPDESSCIATVCITVTPP